MTPKNIAIDADLLQRAGEVVEAEGKTVDELASDALKRDLARRTFDKFRREGDARRRGMTDDQVEAIVEKAVQESRAEQRGR